MSGASKSNPLAKDFRGFVPGQEIPPLKVAAYIDAQVWPSMEWLAENRKELQRAQEAKEPLPKCPPERAIVRFTIIGQMLIPQLTAKSATDHPYGEAPVAVIHEMPFTQYRDLIVQQNPGLAEYANALGAEIVKAAN